MRNEKLRQKKLAKNKKKRAQHNKSYSANSKCKYGAYRTNITIERQNEIFENMKKGFGI
ncbi:MAG: hypothetical protein M0P71_12865 [Melioribacteraceae bacterium]|jgi:hypothetical protein|nr:hypothetical protein [Melioribacteraceae bacterium]